mgnify:CR=1 FL=1
MGGVVAAGDRHTANAGIELLARGGNAVDAAVGATLVACVAEPPLTSPFGGGFACMGRAGEAAHIYDFFADVPGLPRTDPTPPQPLEFAGVELDFGSTTQLFHVGRGAVATPLLLPGLWRLQQEHGRLGVAAVAAPAERLARDGVVISEQVGPIFRILAPILSYSPQARDLFVPGGRTWAAGERFINPELAELLRAWAAGHPDVAETAMLTTFGPPAGLLTAADMANREVYRYAPIQVTVAGRYQVELNPPPSSGGILVAFGLRLFEPVSAAALREPDGLYAHLLAALAVMAAARRDALDGAIRAGGQTLRDAGKRFLSDGYVDSWRDVFARAVREGPSAAPLAGGEPPLGSTTHVSAVDGQGAACAITTSNGEGSGYLVPGTGSMANNFMGEEDLHPGGFHARPPGMRLTSMMCPTVVREDGVPRVALGSGGSNRIRSAVLQVLVRYLLRGESLQSAVDAPRLHYEGGPLFLEATGPGGHALDASIQAALAARAAPLKVFPEPNMFFGGVHAVARGGAGAGDGRRGGAVAHVD